MKIAGVVVTYNRKEDLLKNVEMVFKQRKQFDRFYIIDNCSTDGTYEYLKERDILSGTIIKYIRLNENSGGAGGFWTGVKVASEEGYDLICLMDDDGRPYDEFTIEHLYKKAVELNQSGYESLMINSVVTYDGKNLSFGLGSITTIDDLMKQSENDEFVNYINPFNGTLLSKKLISEIGLPNKDFFIRGDDTDYQNRASNAGAYIVTVTNSIYYHPTFELYKVKWRGRIVRVGICSPWKAYYQIRNYVFQKKRDYGIISAIKEFVFQMYCAKQCNPEYKQCRAFMFKGLYDGMRGKLGRTVLPGQKTIK